MQPVKELSAVQSRQRPIKLVLFILFLVSFVSFLDRYMLGALLPAIKADLRLSDTQLGFMASTAFALIYAFMGLPLGLLADRTSPRRVIAGAMAFWSVMTGLCGLATGFGQLTFARVLVGVGEAAATPAANALIARAIPPDQRAKALTIYSLGLPAGLFFAFLAGGILTQTLGWRLTLLAFAVPGLLLSLILWAMPEAKLGAVAKPSVEAASPKSLGWMDFRRIISRPSFRHHCLGSALFTLTWQGMITWLPSYFTRTYGLSGVEVASKLAVVLGASQAIGLLAGGFAADVGAKRDIRWAFWICSIASLLPVPLYWWIFGGSIGPDIGFIVVFLAFTIGLLQGVPALASVHAVTPIEVRGLSVAIYLMVINIVSGFGALLIGMISDSLSDVVGPRALGFAILGVAIPFSLWSAMHFWLASLKAPADHSTLSSLNSGHL